MSLQIRYLNSYNQRIADTVGNQLKQQKKMAGFYWLEKRLLTYDIPHSKINAADAISRGNQLVLILAIVSCSRMLFV